MDYYVSEVTWYGRFLFFFGSQSEFRAFFQFVLVAFSAKYFHCNKSLSCNKSLLHQAYLALGSYWAKISPQDLLSRPRLIFSQCGPPTWLIRYISQISWQTCGRTSHKIVQCKFCSPDKNDKDIRHIKISGKLGKRKSSTKDTSGLWPSRPKKFHYVQIRECCNSHVNACIQTSTILTSNKTAIIPKIVILKACIS